MAPWISRENAAKHWPDAGRLARDVVDALLDAATEQCAAYAPPLADDATVPARYQLACALQARDIHGAYQRSGDSVLVGDAAYPIRVRPLTDAVKQLLRPQSGAPAILGARTRAALVELDELAP